MNLTGLCQRGFCLVVVESTARAPGEGRDGTGRDAGRGGAGGGAEG